MTSATLTVGITLAFLGLIALFLGISAVAWALRWRAARGRRPLLPFCKAPSYLPLQTEIGETVLELQGQVLNSSDSAAEADVAHASGQLQKESFAPAVSHIETAFSLADSSLAPGSTVGEPDETYQVPEINNSGSADTGSPVLLTQHTEDKNHSLVLGKIAHPVRYLSEKNSHSLLRFVPWDATGTLLETDDGFRFIGSSYRGEILDMSFPSEEIEIDYQKTSLFWDGGRAWCVIEVNGERHFFSAAGTSLNSAEQLAGNSRAEEEETYSTTYIYRSLTNRYIRSN